MITNDKAVEYIADRRDFVNYGKTLRGNSGGSVNHGHMDDLWRVAYLADLAQGIDYTVYSYRTPIAWYCDGEWTVPPVKYTVTTSRHQNIVRQAIASSLAMV